jgi:hypothetical protein
VNAKTYTYQGPSRLKYVDTKEIFDVQPDKDKSPLRSNAGNNTNAIEIKSVAKSSISSSKNNN